MATTFGLALGLLLSRRTRQRQAIGRAVLLWCREGGGPLAAIRSAVDHAGAAE